MCNEKIAKEKVCPFMSNAATIGIANNMYAKVKHANCVASECMSWEFLTDMYDDKNNRLGICKLIDKG